MKRSVTIISLSILGTAVVGLVVGQGSQIVLELVVAAVLGLCGNLLWRAGQSLYLLLIFFWFQLFESPLSTIVGSHISRSVGAEINRADVYLLALLVVSSIAARVDYQAKPKRSTLMVGPLLILLCGLVSDAEHGAPIIVSIIGAFLSLKLWIILFVALSRRWNRADQITVYNNVVVGGWVIAILGLVNLLAPRAWDVLFVSANEHLTYRADAVSSTLATPGSFAVTMSILFGIVAARFYVERRRTDLLTAVAFLIVDLLSLRLKSVLDVVAAVACLGLVAGHGRGYGQRIGALTLAIIVFVGIYTVEGNIINTQITTYASSESSARGLLYSTSWNIVADDLPLGVGFGRYGSYESSAVYSPVYSEYGLSDVWGLSPSFPDYISDTSWPSLLGETGLLGTIGYVIGLGMLIIYCRRKLRTCERAYYRGSWGGLGAVVALVVLVVDSIGDPSLFLTLPVTLVTLFIAICLRVPISDNGVARSDAINRELMASGGDLVPAR